MTKRKEPDTAAKVVAKSHKKTKRFNFSNELKLSGEFFKLEEDGYQVIQGVVDTKLCDETTAGLKNWYKSLDLGVTDIESPDQWKVLFDNTAKKPSTHYGIHHHYGAGFLQPVWNVRQDPRVVDVFSRMWHTDQLLTSFDGFCLAPPHEWLDKSPSPKANPDYKDLDYKYGAWYHCDQGPAKLGRQCIQGFVALEDMGPEDATLMVLPKSHLWHQAFFDAFPSHLMSTNRDWIKYTKEEMEWWSERIDDGELKVVAPKGSLVLWDSRTVHCSGTAQFLRRNPNRWRSLVYVCCQPRSMAEPKDITRKIKYFHERRTCNHWPIHFTPFNKDPHFGVKARHLKQPADDLCLTALGKQLCGF